MPVIQPNEPQTATRIIRSPKSTVARHFVSFPSANHAENLLLSQSQPPTQSHNVGRGAPPSTAAHFFTVALRFPIYLSTADAAAEQRGSMQRLFSRVIVSNHHPPTDRSHGTGQAWDMPSRQQLERSCLGEAPTKAGASACFAAQSRESSGPLGRVAMTLSRLIHVHAMRLAARGSGYPHSLPAKGSKLSLPVAHISSLPHTQPPMPTMGG
ncbi:hypothetical protein CKAH01_02462 [Colletotrichum kahawae]|uniref:Uncharacterized protein n=1 Tax=Colletotrichum kahawae TaxID=34407 RepID=A0AAE0CZ31_COLKA|nr:hypothetical protein CKAH01_02462 [Colletotrichum kahawae]